MAQVVSRMPLRHEAKVSAVNPPGQPLVQLMLPAARELAAKAPGRTRIGAPGLKKVSWLKVAYVLESHYNACHVAEVGQGHDIHACRASVTCESALTSGRQLLG